MSKSSAFYEVLTAAVHDFLVHGFDSEDRLKRWVHELSRTAQGALMPESVLLQTLRSTLEMNYRRATSLSKLKKVHAQLSEYTLERIKPSLRAELDRRILASANLIRLNRDVSIQRTLQRFAGWATSIPIGGTEVSQREEVKTNVRRGIAGLPFEERRVVIDQGHKLVAAINDIVATDGGAIAAMWHHVNEAGYNARPEHLARDKHLFVLRGNWALKEGLIRLGGTEYTDQIDTPATKPYCRCWFEYLYNLRDLPDNMLTAKGRQALIDARAAARRA